MHLELSRAGTTAPYCTLPLEVRWYHPCTWRWYARDIPVCFYAEITLGKMTVVPRASTRVVPSYLLEVHYPLSSTQYICFAVLPNDLGRQEAVQLQVQS